MTTGPGGGAAGGGPGSAVGGPLSAGGVTTGAGAGISTGGVTTGAGAGMSAGSETTDAGAAALSGGVSTGAGAAAGAATGGAVTPEVTLAGRGWFESPKRAMPSAALKPTAAIRLPVSTPLLMNLGLRAEVVGSGGKS